MRVVELALVTVNSSPSSSEVSKFHMREAIRYGGSYEQMWIAGKGELMGSSCVGRGGRYDPTWRVKEATCGDT